MHSNITVSAMNQLLQEPSHLFCIFLIDKFRHRINAISCVVKFITEMKKHLTSDILGVERLFSRNLTMKILFIKEIYMRILLVIMSVLMFSPNLSSAPILEFDGFPWGSSRNDIIEIRGSPTYLYDTSISYTDVEDEIAGYGIQVIFFMFKEGCSKLKETISEPCSLWQGTYNLEGPTEKVLDELTALISSSYGEYTTESVERRNEDYSTKKLIALETWTTRTFTQVGGSSISVVDRKGDRDFESYGTSYKKGVTAINVTYQSANYNEVQERKKQKKKGF